MRNRRNVRKSKKNNNILNIIEIILILLIIITLIIFIPSVTKRKSIPNEINEFSKENTTEQIEQKETNSTENTSNETNTSIENSNTQNSTETIPQEVEKDTTFTMAVTGDIMCHNTMFQDAYNAQSKEYDFSYMFEDIKYYLQTADITVGNLETTFAGKKVGYSGYPTFNTPEILAKNLKKIGFDVLSTANNHCMDKGYAGIESTIKYLDSADISHTGTFSSKEKQNEIIIKDVKGVKIAFLSYTYGTNGITIPKGKEYSVNLIDKDLISKHLKLAKKENPDIICVCMHWGTEYQTTPNETQKDLANFLFKNGADIVLGNHPHVIQPMEKRTIKLEDGTTKDGFIVYSLGNFMADQSYKYTRDSAILNLQITKHKETDKISIDTVTYTPTYVYKKPSSSKKRFKILDMEDTIAAYKAKADTSIGSSMYKTLLTEVDNVKKLLGKEIK